jgi:hypothetical protein
MISRATRSRQAAQILRAAITRLYADDYRHRHAAQLMRDRALKFAPRGVRKMHTYGGIIFMSLGPNGFGSVSQQGGCSPPIISFFRRQRSSGRFLHVFLRRSSLDVPPAAR